MSEKHRWEGFRALLEDHRNCGHFFEETDGSWRRWRDLSPEAKLQYIAGDAALYDVPFETFLEAVQESLSKSALAQAALWTVWGNAKELHGLAKLLPPDGRTESTPLIERFKEILHESSGPERAPEQNRDRGIER